MLRIINLAEIESLLLEAPALVGRFEARDPSFRGAVNDWLKSMAEILGKNHMTVASEVAVLRGTLFASERSLPNDGLVKIAKTGTKQAGAASILKQATQTVSAAIHSRQLQVAEAERVMSQIVAAAYQLGVISAETDQSHTVYLQQVKQTLSSRAELVSLTVHVLGLVGSMDFLILLDRALTAWNSH